MERTVLIVDDERTFLDRFAEEHDAWFNGLNLEVATADSVRKARQFLQKRGTEVEIVIIDIRLPQSRHAVNLFTYVRERLPAVRRIAMTVHAQKDDIGSLVAGRLIEGYFNKDWPKQKIRKEITRVLEELCEPTTHTQISNAIRQWLDRNPAAKQQKMRTLSGRARTMEDIVSEIERGTPLGARQERLIYQLAWNLFIQQPQRKNR